MDNFHVMVKEKENLNFGDQTVAFSRCFTELPDFPERNPENDGNGSQLVETVVVEKKSSDNDDGYVLFTDGPIMVIALGTASAVVLIACILAVMCTFSAAKRRHRKCQGHHHHHQQQQQQHWEKEKQFDDTEFIGVIDSKPSLSQSRLPSSSSDPPATRIRRHQRCPEHGDYETCSLCRHDSSTFRHSTSAHSCTSKASGASQRPSRFGSSEETKSGGRPAGSQKAESTDGRWTPGADVVVVGCGSGVIVEPDCEQLIDLYGIGTAGGAPSLPLPTDGVRCTFDEKLSSTVPKLPVNRRDGGGGGCGPMACSLPRGGPLPMIQPATGVAMPPNAAVTNVDLLPLRPFLLPTGFDDRYDIDPLANAAAINGYLSGENVDDDIDQEDFTIRMPSIDERMCDYVSSPPLAATTAAAASGAGWVQTMGLSNHAMVQRIS